MVDDIAVGGSFKFTAIVYSIMFMCLIERIGAICSRQLFVSVRRTYIVLVHPAQYLIDSAIQ